MVDVRSRDARGRTALHHAASAANAERCRVLLAEGADPDALDDDARSAADLVSVGDPSCDPEDCAAWRALKQQLSAAERDARELVHEEGFDPALSTRGVRERVLRACGSVRDRGGGTRSIRCVHSERTGSGWFVRVVVISEYAGVNPAFDPPWTQETSLDIALDDRGWPVR